MYKNITIRAMLPLTKPDITLELLCNSFEYYIEDSWIEGPLYRVLAEHQASIAEDPGTPDH